MPRRTAQSLALLAVMLMSLVGCAAPWQSHSNPIPAATVTATSIARSASAASFAKGVFAFPGQRNPQVDAKKAGVVGGVLLFTWAQLEPQPGVFRWDLIEHDMQPWLAAGKLVMLRVRTTARASIGARIVQATPQWVFDAGARHVVEIDGTIIPVYWDHAYLSAYAAFVRAFGARFDGAAGVVTVHIGAGMWGETQADTVVNPKRLALWQAVGYSNALWNETLKTIIGFYTASFHRTPLTLMTAYVYLQYGGAYTGSALLHQPWVQGLWIEFNGVTRTTALPDRGWHASTFIAEQLLAATVHHYPLIDDLRRAVALGASYIICFSLDIENPANASALAWVQEQ